MDGTQVPYSTVHMKLVDVLSSTYVGCKQESQNMSDSLFIWFMQDNNHKHESGTIANKKRFGGIRNPIAKLGTQEHENFVKKWMIRVVSSLVGRDFYERGN